MIQTGRRCIFPRSGSGADSDGREDRPVPARNGATPLTEPLSIFVTGKGPLSCLLSFTSDIPDCRRFDTWKVASSKSLNQESVSPGLATMVETDTFGVDRRQGVRLLGSQTHVLHPKGVEHIPQHRLFFRREIARGLLFQDREQVDNFFRLR